MDKRVNLEEANQKIALDSKYKWWRDDKITGTILLILSVSLQIFAFMEVPGLTTFHKYTVGMIFGWFNPLFYIFFVFLSCQKMFGSRFPKVKWFKLKKSHYWFVALGVVIIATNTGFYQSKGSWTELLDKPWHAMRDWWHDFTIDSKPWAPNPTNGGFIGALSYSLIATLTSGVGSLVASILVLFLIISLFTYGSFSGLYKAIFYLIFSPKSSNRSANQPRKKDYPKKAKLSHIGPDNLILKPANSFETKNEPKKKDLKKNLDMEIEKQTNLVEEASSPTPSKTLLITNPFMEGEVNSPKFLPIIEEEQIQEWDIKTKKNDNKELVEDFYNPFLD